MTPTIPHILLTTHGNLPGGETWSCGLRTLATATDVAEATGIALCVAVSNRWRVLANTAVAAYLFGNNTGNTVAATIDGTTFRRINEDGITVQQFEGSPTTSLTAVGSSAPAMPNQVCLVATLVTARAGRTGKGRIYLPAISGPALTTGGRISSGNASSIATAMKVLLDGMNTDLRTATDGAQAMAVQSGKASQEPGVWTPGAPSGYMGAKIISVRIGDTFDTQRRRRSSITEAYATATLAA